jgi:hypothetical protein
VFHIDHHSPWVNNCIGLENLRFYLLFIFYLLLAVGYNLITVRAIWNHYIYKQNMQLMNFVYVFDQFLFLVLICVNIWHWTVAMTGMSTVDVICGGSSGGQNSFVSSTGKKHRLTFRNVQDNLYKVFGTQSTIAILSPSLRGMPFSGVEWTYQARDLGFKEEIESDEEDGLHKTEMSIESGGVQDDIELTELNSSKVVHQVKGSAASSSLDSIMEDNDI